jgi:hypothetical protein
VQEDFCELQPGTKGDDDVFHVVEVPALDSEDVGEVED